MARSHAWRLPSKRDGLRGASAAPSVPQLDTWPVHENLAVERSADRPRCSAAGTAVGGAPSLRTGNGDSVFAGRWSAMRSKTGKR
mmetsp:Transcript_29902/g.85679  ORF Transcript_29902/g.85679 Transcript_29902/m.85679 type:complete len:85 (-) Transcript_29902:254-508(-)